MKNYRGPREGITASKADPAGSSPPRLAPVSDDGKMDPGEYVLGLHKMALLVKFVLDIDFDKMAEAQNVAMSFSPLIDPTLWIKKGDDLTVDARATAAFCRLKEELRSIYKL